MALNLLPLELREKFEVAETHHVAAILHEDFQAEWRDWVMLLGEFRLLRSHILRPGGRKSPISLAFGIKKRAYQPD